MTFIKTTNFGERRNCTVRAFHHAFNIPYEEAYEVLKTIGGRKENKGINFEAFMKKLGWHYKGIIFKRHSMGRVSLNKFMESDTKGTYIAKVSGHVFAIIDGVIYDTHEQSGRRQLIDLWSIGTNERPILASTIRTSFKVGFKKSQRTIIIELYKNGTTSVDAIVAKTQIKKANVQWYFSQLKFKNIAC